MNSKTFFPIAVLLVIASFLVGLSWTKLPFVKSNLTVANPSPKAQVQANPQENQPQVLGAQEMDNLVKGGTVLGAQDAKVTVVEFSDPSCPYCAAAAGADITVGKDESGNEIKIISGYLQKNNPGWEAPMPKLEEMARQGKIRLVFRYYPGHGTGEKAMMAAWCAAEQDKDKFWSYLNLLFANPDKFSDVNQIVELGGTLGLDKQKLLTCIQSDKYKNKITEDIKAGQEVAKQTGKEGFGTPTFFVNGQMMVGAQSWQAFAALIDEESKK